MKLLYYILIPVLTLLILWFAYLLWFIRPVEIDRKMVETTRELLQKKDFISQDGNNIRRNTVTLSQSVWDKNLFDPSRGTAAKSVVAGPGELNVEVLGIYSYNKDVGAIIVPKQGTLGAVPGGAYGGGYGGAPGYNQPGQQGGAKSGRKAFYKLGETLDNGYTLTAIGRDYVELSGGGNKVKVPLKFDSDESLKRIAAEAKNDVKKQITIIQGIGSAQPAQTGNQQPQGGSGSVTVISSQQQQQQQQQGGAVYGNQR